MKAFALYTLARAGLFAAAFGLIWLLFGRWLDWSAVSALYTAIIALIVSSVASLFVLRSLRDELALDVSRQAERAKAAYDARRAAEDVGDPATPGDEPPSARHGDDAAGK